MAFRLPDAPDARLALAKGYPYDAPAACFLWRAGADGAELRPIAEADFSGRTPVLAHGSNRAPAQLARKFLGRPGLERDIPVTAGWLHDTDVVYSAHVTGYGAIASTLRRVPGCRVRVAVTWLSDAQLARMHETEGANYHYGRLARRFVADSGPRAAFAALPTYLSDHGSLTRGDGRPLGLAAVRAEGRPHAALTQDAAQELVRAAHHPAETLDRHILANIADARRRLALVGRLRADALAADFADFAALARTGAGPAPAPPAAGGIG